ncbi:hypothetical protein EIC82_00410 [Enterobacter sp. A11]|nr:hypothetical protein EIC82_00410 [Enterobacter sp. A11]
MRQIYDRFMKNLTTINGKLLFYYSGYFLPLNVYNRQHLFSPRISYAHTSHFGLASGSKLLQQKQGS